MATLLARPEDVPSREPTPAPAHLTLNTSLQGQPTAVPNKHIPFCSPGPDPDEAFPSTPQTPPSTNSFYTVSSLLDPPSKYKQLNADPPVYALTASQLSSALDSIATQPLPDPKQVFPWLHGIHIENQLQLAYFSARQRSVPPTPTAFRAVTIVKAGGGLSDSRLKGAIAPEELLANAGDVSTVPVFREVDPRVGFSVRNFQIQAAKIAQISDIVVYGDDATPRSEVEQLTAAISAAQRAWLEHNDETGKFNTFLVNDSFSKVQAQCSELVAVDAKGALTGEILDFAFQERLEMCALSKASEIAQNVWLGPTPDPRLFGTAAFVQDETLYDIMIEANDFGRIPDQHTLSGIESFFKNKKGQPRQVQLEFPASGSMSVQSSSDGDVKKLIDFCAWLFSATTSSGNASRRPKILLHCADGYTETSLLGLAYTMYATGKPLDEAWIYLHRDQQRNFFAYPSDKLFLLSIQERLLKASPAKREELPAIGPCAWLDSMDGSLPSRILPYLYLGNLNHAQNPAMLKQLGISRILSIGEPIKWSDDQVKAWGAENFVFIDKVQDNGVDPLTCEFDRCLAFIGKCDYESSLQVLAAASNAVAEKAKADGHATLVHCRVGVSRSATICIAEVMKELGISFPRA